MRLLGRLNVILTSLTVGKIQPRPGQSIYSSHYGSEPLLHRRGGLINPSGPARCHRVDIHRLTAAAQPLTTSTPLWPLAASLDVPRQGKYGLMFPRERSLAVETIVIPETVRQRAPPELQGFRFASQRTAVPRRNSLNGFSSLK